MDFKEMMNDAIKMMHQKNYVLAKQKFNKILRKVPNHPLILANLAILSVQENDVLQAENYFTKSLEINFDHKIYNDFIQLLMSKKKWHKVTDSISSHINEKSMGEVIYLNYAIALREIKEIDEALNVFNRLTKKFPSFVNGWIGYGSLLNKTQKYNEAIEVFKKSVALHPNNFILNFNLGITYANINEPEESIKLLKEAIKIEPNSYQLWITLAAQLIKIRKFKDVEKSLDKCRQLEPGNLLTNFQNGILKMQLGDIALAENEFKNVLDKSPNDIEANFHLGLVKLMQGHFKESIYFYRYRVKRMDKFGKFDDFDFPKLDQNKQILIAWEQGLGDQLLYLRLLPEFLKTYKNVTYVSSNKLFPILSKSFSDIKVISDDFYEKNHLDFAEFQKINLATIIHYVPDVNIALQNNNNFLHRAKNQASYNTAKKIGLSWRSNNRKIGGEKSISLKSFSPIFFNNCEYISLQYGDVTKEIDEINSHKNISILVEPELDYFNDIEGLMKLIAKCDLVISSSNFTAHLAGSMNIPTLLLCPKSFGKLWYWYENENTKSKWYPCMSILQQEVDKDWGREILKIQKLLKN
jgi:tetratricopeptide (TPR) repeat protein